MAMTPHTHNWCSCDGQGGEGRIDRRTALTAGLLAGVWWMSARSAWAQASFRPKQKAGHTLVVVFLRGGADGLNLVAPYAEDDYYRLRPTLAIAKPGAGEGRLLDLDGHFGLNPGLRPLEAPFKDGRLAIVHACGSGDQTRSHFEAMGTMERGLHDRPSAASDGWLARHIAATPERSAPLRAVALTSTMPDSLGGVTSALAVPNISDVKLSALDEDQRTRFMASLARLYGPDGDQMEQAGHATLDVLKTLTQSDPNQYQAANGATYPDTDLGRTFRQVAFLIRKEVGLEVACLDFGGWDTHIAQGTTAGWLTGLATELANSVAAFMTDLGTEMSRVTVVVQSEFGRRLEENSGFGTDHGRGGVMMVAGGGARGGKVYGDWPTLSPGRRVGPGDLDVTTDYRDVLGEVLAKRLQTPDLGRVFPGLDHRPIGLYA